jgi:ribosomal-protein-alanine N-acetyltransferase
VARIEDLREEDIAELLAMDAGASRLKEELARPWARVRVVRDEAGRAVAFLLAWLVADEAHLLDVVVSAGRRREGIGRALLGDFVDGARAHGARNAYLEVRISNEPAIRLYRSAGFTDARVRKGYYPDGEDALEMALSLP